MSLYNIRDELISQLVQIETATIGHLINYGFMEPQIQCILPGIRICGPAVTVSLPKDDGFSLPIALDHACAGDVLVIERIQDDRHACWGAVMTAAAQQVGIVGVVIDGFITDISAISDSGFPVWCKGRSPVTTKQGKTGGAVNIPVICGGVNVNPGDIVLADENGVLALSLQELNKYLMQALQIQQQEPLIIKRLQQGESLSDIYRL